MDRVAGRGGILDPLGILQVFASRVVIDLAYGAAPFSARLEGRL